MKGQLIAAIVENITTRKDRSLKVVIGTQEMNPGAAAQLLQYAHQLVTIYISPAAVDNREIEQVDKIDPELNNKSQSQRIRNVLYLLHQQADEGFKDFDTFYKAKTELYIEHLKTKLQ
jgi:hypothetical protein